MFRHTFCALDKGNIALNFLFRLVQMSSQEFLEENTSSRFNLNRNKFA